jgi:hypothetical protein
MVLSPQKRLGNIEQKDQYFISLKCKKLVLTKKNGKPNFEKYDRCSAVAHAGVRCSLSKQQRVCSCAAKLKAI